MLLNSKSIVDCNYEEEQKHNEEIDELLELLYEVDNYECAVVIKCENSINKDKSDIIKQCNLYDCLEMVEYVDAKNGIDLEISDNNIFTIVAYGQSYECNGKYELVKNLIHIMPYDDNRDFLDISNIFLNTRSSLFN